MTVHLTPTVIPISAHHLELFPGRDPAHRVIIARTSIDYIEFTEPHGSRTNSPTSPSGPATTGGPSTCQTRTTIATPQPCSIA